MIKAYLKAFNILTDVEIENFIQLSTPRKLSKSDIFIHDGDVCKEVAFLLSGIFRSFYISPEGEEITYCITFPNNFMTAYSSFISGKSSSENIQAITAAELLVIPKHEIENLLHQSPNWIMFMKVVAEQQYIELENRVFQLQRDNATQRYGALLKNHPEYLQHIPLQYLASYLGITQRHLSRIRKEIFV